MTTIVLATPTLNPAAGGPAYSVSAIGENLKSRGIDTQFTVLHGRAFVPIGANYSLLPWRGDLVHNFGLWTALNQWASWSSRAASLPAVLSPIGMLEPWCLAHHGLRKRLALSLYQRRNLERADAIHVTADQELRTVRDLGLKSPVAVIPHGVDLPVLPEREHEGAARKRRLLFLSRLHQKKGLLDLVRAWSVLRPIDWEVVIAGPDEAGHRSELERAVSAAGIAADFTFTGPVYAEAKTRLFASCDLFVLPTYSENFGLVVPEALAHGLPVITTDAAPWGELVETGSGWWISPGADPLIATLRTALAMSPENLRAMGARGRGLVQERYGWNAIIEKHIRLYRWLIHGEPRPGFISN